jgi:hypothetical protein
MIVFAGPALGPAGRGAPACCPAFGMPPGAGAGVAAPQNTQCADESGISFVQLGHFFTAPPPCRAVRDEDGAF